MAETATLSALERTARRTETVFAIAVVGILAVLLMPVPGWILSSLIALNLCVSILVLLVCVYAKEAMEFNAFPSLLLITTMLRLGLNVAATRLILTSGEGGGVIETFGHFVVGGNFVVGVVIFIILVIIQLVVITKGAGRISEVAARFVLDAMPGKQMAIDADLNSGLISEREAKERRARISQEAEFYGAMDGASKFVKGDAIAGLIITIINIIAGFIIGMTMLGMDASESLKHFTMLTIGEGLVSQIPSLLITVGSGLLVTKTRSDQTMANELSKELLFKPAALRVGAGMIALLGLIPGMPFLPFFILGGTLLWLSGRMAAAQAVQGEEKSRKTKDDTDKKKAEEKPEDNLVTNRLLVEIGYRLIPLVDKERGGRLLDSVTAMRRSLAADHGLIVPPVRIKDNMSLGPNTYRILLHGQPIATGELHPDKLLAIDGGGVVAPAHGIATKDPAFGLPAVWIEPGRRAEAESLGYTVTEPTQVFHTHLQHVVKSNAAQLLSREDIATMLAALKRDAPALVKEVEASVKPGVLQKVLAALLEERVPITNLEKIVEAVADTPALDPAALAEQVRSRIGRNVVAPWLDPQGRLAAIIFEPATEARLAQSLGGQGGSAQLAITPADASALVDQIGRALHDGQAQGRDPVLLTTAGLRRSLRQITARFHPDLAVLSYAELGTTAVDVVGTVQIAKP